MAETAKAQQGVKKAAIMQAVMSKRSMIIAYCGILLLALSTSIESQSTFTFNPYITSEFKAHTMLSTVSIVSNLLSTVLKAPIAKLADVFGRLEVLIGVIISFILGYVCIASCHNISTYFASQVLYSIGSNGCMLIIQLVIADTSSIHNRVLCSIMPSVPFLVAVWVGPLLGETFLKGAGWRWGMGIWSIILPVAALPLVIVLLVNQRRGLRAMREALALPVTTANSEAANSEDGEKIDSLINRKQQLRENSDDYRLDDDEANVLKDKNFWQKCLYYAVQLDLLGSLLLTIGLSLLLLPLTLVTHASGGWRNPGIITSITLGPFVCAAFFIYDTRYAKFPIVSVHVLKEKVVCVGCLAAAFFFMTFYIFDVYQTSYFQVANGVSPAQAGYVNNIFSFGSTIFGVCVGFLIKYFKKVRVFILVGSTCFFIGLIVLIVTVEKGYGIKMMMFAMALYAAGSGWFAMPAQTSVQSTCRRQDVGAATAFYLTSTMLGASIGSALSGALWPHYLVRNLQQRLPAELIPLAQEIADDLTKAIAYPMGSPARDAINDSYRQTYRILVYGSFAAGTIFTILTWFIKCRDLDDKAQEDEEEPLDKSLTQAENRESLLA